MCGITHSQIVLASSWAHCLGPRKQVDEHLLDIPCFSFSKDVHQGLWF